MLVFIFAMLAIIAVATAYCWQQFALSWRETNLILRGGWELFCGFRAMRKFPYAVTAFGSARLNPGSEAYQLLYGFLFQLAERSKKILPRPVTILTAGGPGAMQAGNQAGHDAGVETVGLNILLPSEQAPNEFCSTVVNFWHFFARKVCLVQFSKAFVLGDGSFGTDSELIELLILMQTGKIPERRIYIIDPRYGQQLLDSCICRLKRGLIGGMNLDLITLVNCPEVPDVAVMCDTELNGSTPREVRMRRLDTQDQAIDEILQACCLR